MSVCKNIEKRLNIKDYWPFLLAAIVCVTLSFADLCFIWYGNSSDTPPLKDNIISEYKSSRQASIYTYNSLIADAQKSNKTINVPDFNNDDGTSFEHYFDNNANVSVGSSTKTIIKKLDKRLVTINKLLVNRLKQVNNAIKNNLKINYDSLKIGNIVKDDNELKPIIKEYVKNYQQESKIKWSLILLAINSVLGLLIMLVCLSLKD